MAEPPSKIIVAVHVHRVWKAEQNRTAAYRHLAEARSAARADGIAPRAMDAAIAALKRNDGRTLSPAAQAIFDAVRAVPIGAVALGAFSDTRAVRTVTGSNDGAIQ